MDWIARLDIAIRDGKVDQAREDLRLLKLNKIQRDEYAAIGNIARRVDLPELALKLLSPVVRPKGHLKKPASPVEIAVYASCLTRFGALEESRELLTKLIQNSKSAVPAEAHLYLGFNMLSSWDYALAIAPLKRYLKETLPTEYDKTVAKINLASCYQFLNQDTKIKNELITETINLSRQHDWARLLRNALELKTQANISEGNWIGAQTALEEAFALSSSADLLLQKWCAVLNLKMNGASAKHLSQLKKVREQALAAGDAEVVRDCDFYLASEAKDQELMARLYLGTCHRSYKKHLQERAQDWIQLPATYVWTQGSPARIFDLSTGKEEGRPEIALKKDQALLRLFAYLASDFYRRFPLGSVFTHLYPGEYYNVESSPAKVNRLIERLRKWFVESDIPLDLVIANNRAWLQFKGEYGLRLSQTSNPRKAKS